MSIETDAPPTLLMPIAGDRCAACGTPLASDQRYCLECGEPGARARTRPAPRRDEPPAVREAQPPSRMRPTAGATLVAGVGTLVLAIGVGVLIGRTGSHGTTTARAPAVQVVTVAGAASPAEGARGTTTNAQTSAAGSGAKAHARRAHPSRNAARVPAAIPKSGTTVKKAKGKVVSVGSKGSGPGYQNGRFTGNFFGG